MRAQPTSPRNSGSGIPLVALGVLGVAAGLIDQSPACAAFGVALLALTGAVRAWLRWQVQRLQVATETPDRAFEGDCVEVRFRLTNRSPLPLFFPRLHEIFVPEVQAQKDVLFELRLEPGEVAEGSYRAYCVLPRGVYRLGPILLTLSDPFGWFQVQRRLPVERQIKVYPAVGNYGVDEREGGSWTALMADLTRACIGETTEFLSVREYRRGDPLRRIHWGLSAHRGELVVREHCRDADGDLFIFIDLCRLAHLGTGRGSTTESSVRIAAALAAHSLRKGRGAAVHTGRWTGLGQRRSGEGGVQEILEALLYVRPEGETSFEDVLETEASRIPSGSVIILPISPYLRDSARLRHQIQSLRRRDVRIVAICYDEETFRKLYESQGVDCPIDSFVGELRAGGVEAHRVTCGAPPEIVFRGQGSSAA